MFGIGVKPKRKYTKSKPQQSRVDKIISILHEANEKDKTSYKPKRKKKSSGTKYYNWNKDGYRY